MISYAGLKVAEEMESRRIAASAVQKAVKDRRDKEDRTQHAAFLGTLVDRNGNPKPFTEQHDALSAYATETRANFSEMVARREASLKALEDIRTAIDNKHESDRAEITAATAAAISKAIGTTNGSMIGTFFGFLTKRPKSFHSVEELGIVRERVQLEYDRLNSEDALDMERRALASAQEAEHELTEFLRQGELFDLSVALIPHVRLIERIARTPRNQAGGVLATIAGLFSIDILQVLELVVVDGRISQGARGSGDPFMEFRKAGLDVSKLLPPPTDQHKEEVQ